MFITEEEKKGLEKFLFCLLMALFAFGMIVISQTKGAEQLSGLIQVPVWCFLIAGFLGFCLQVPALIRGFQKHWRIVLPTIVVCSIVAVIYWRLVW